MDSPNDIPDEIITNILIWLPVKSLVRFQLVCKGWRDTISSRGFVDLHETSSNPLIFVSPASPFGLFVIDKWWTDSIIIHRFPFKVASAAEEFSHGGLIVFYVLDRVKPYNRILNPARSSDECVVINFTNEFLGQGSHICAVYYHPLLVVYCSLWVVYKSDLLFEYKLLIMDSKPSFRRIRNPFTYRVKDKWSYPLLINNHLYWLLKSEQYRYEGRNDILEFDIISEEFKVIPCPIPLNTECSMHQVHMVNSDGVFSYILFLPSTITIWRLVDPVQEMWTSIEFSWKITMDYRSYECYTFHVVALVDGKLAFRYKGMLFVCNLMEGTVKKYPDEYTGVHMSHKMTLASLKNCKSELYIDNDGNLVV